MPSLTSCGATATRARPQAPKSKKRVDLVKELGLDNSAAAAAAPVVAAPASETELLSKGNWFPLAKLSDFAGEKKRKICELKVRLRL